MQIVQNSKKFKVLNLTTREARRAGMGTTEGCICMHCNDIIKNNIYYIAVFNDCMCPNCYQEWYKGAENYPEDRKYEERNYNYYLNNLH